MKRVFIGSTGLVRSGWVILTFALIAGLSQVPLAMLFGAIFGRGTNTLHLDEWRIASFTWPTLLSSALATALCVRFFREKTGLTQPRSLFFGLAMGALALTLAVVVPALMGHGTLGWPTATVCAIALSGVTQLITIGATSIGEELLFRGLAFQALSRGTHPLIAIFATSLLFGLGHLNNPNASLVAAANVALVGLWFGLIAWRHSLYASIGLHLAWNWFEGFVFGQPVSGLMPGPSLLGATWSDQRSFWEGGAFGPEASGWSSVVLCLGIVFIVLIRPSSPRNSGPAPVLNPD